MMDEATEKAVTELHRLSEAEAAPTGRNRSVLEAAQWLGISRGQLYVEISRGSIVPIHIGRRTLIPEQELRRFTAEKLAEARAARGARDLAEAG